MNGLTHMHRLELPVAVDPLLVWRSATKTDGSQGDEIGNHIGERVDGLLPSFRG